MDVSGKCVMDNLKVCKNRIREIKSFLCDSVLGVNQNSVQIQKPFSGSVINGLQLQIYTSHVHNEPNINLADHHAELLENAINNESLNTIIKETWNLISLPKIKNIHCEFVQSYYNLTRSTDHQPLNNTSYDDCDVDTNVLQEWNTLTKYESVNTRQLSTDEIELERYTS
eukprot:887157_1